MTEPKSKKPLKIFFHAVDGIGHLNACVGMAQALAQRGHHIYFLLNDAFAGQFSKFSFDEILLTQKPPTKDTAKQEESTKDEKKNPVKDIAEMLLKSGMLGPKSALEKVRDQARETPAWMEKFVDQMIEYNPQIDEAIKRVGPDLFILDNFLVPPAIRQIPWMFLFSPNPLMLYRSDNLPPLGSGISAESDPETWQEFNALWKESWIKNFVPFQERLNQELNYEPAPEEQLSRVDPKLVLSPYLNIYGFPAELDYNDIVPRPGDLAAVDAFCRVEPEPFELPQEIVDKSGDKLIYVSLGSMGSIDVDLMQRILAVLEKTPHKYIVSKGQRGEEYSLPSNCWGENFLPQPKILPLVDLVITHGGNNTITETMAFGKPMIVMPLFGDQYDNAQRVQDKGYGLRLEPYQFKDDQLIGAIEQLLADTKLQEKAKTAAERMAKSNSKERVCERIEQVVDKFQKA